jgi:serine/threonine-protein kinase PknK
VLPGYRDVAEIGGSPFATVYRAIEIDTGRPVALKILKLGPVQPAVVESSPEEIQALAKVSDHPNIVTLYRSLTTPDGRPALVLELCRESLAQQVGRSGVLTPRQITRTGIKIAGALETAHRRGLLHRDMKPQNLLVTQFGEPALADFGLAGWHAQAATAGLFGYTTVHAAPEILEGNQLSPATDIYGLASTMYELLNGSAPFASFDNEAPASVILRIIRNPVPPLRGDDIPIGLADLLEAALAKDPHQRPASALDFADAMIAVESAAGWAPTVYVAWDERGPIGRHNAEPVPAPAVPDSPVRLYVAPPSVQAPGSPPSPSDASANEMPWGQPPAGRPVSAEPSVAAPAATARNVIGPERIGRGHDNPQDPPVYIPPLRPIHPVEPPSPGSPRAGRPVFVDPPGPAEPTSGSGAVTTDLRPSPTVAPETLPEAGVAVNSRNGNAPPGSSRSRRPSAVLIGGFTAAAAVLVAAVLVVVGVL